MSIHSTGLGKDSGAVSPRRTQHILDIGNTKFYELLAAGELVSFKIGKSRKITVASIEAYVARQIAAAEREIGR